MQHRDPHRPLSDGAQPDSPLHAYLLSPYLTAARFGCGGTARTIVNPNAIALASTLLANAERMPVSMEWQSLARPTTFTEIAEIEPFSAISVSQ